MQRFLQLSVIVVMILIAGCAQTYVETMVTSQGAVIEVDGARLEIPTNSVVDSVTVRVEVHGGRRKDYEQGYATLGKSFVIFPETLVFQKPARFSFEVQGTNLGLGSNVGGGFVPLAVAEAIDNRVVADVWHGGSYSVIRKPDTYGIIDHTKTAEGLLVVADIYVSDYVRDFRQALRQNGYDLPVWLFVYRPDISIEENALLLHKELKRLHGEYGEFRLDVVSFGIGGLVTHRYLTDSAYYLKDISSAVIAIGTPFLGSNFAILENVKLGSSPFKFFFVDGLAKNAGALAPGSEFISRVKETRYLPGFHYYDDPSENKNFVSLHGRKPIEGAFAEENNGDGIVSVNAAMLTPVEPAAFELEHFELFESNDVHRIATEFALLYRSFNWPLLFSKVWSGRESFSRINETWTREVKLHLRNDGDFEALLEFNRNMLMSAPEGAVLITNGDYDTYPAWCLQENGFRTDVLIVNRSLLNLKDYARFLMQHGLPLEISDQELMQIEHKKADDKFVTISDQLMHRLLRQSRRPVVFSTTVYTPSQYGYPLKLSGLVYEISESDIDISRTKELLYEIFQYSKIFSRPLDSFNANIQSMVKNYAATAFSLSSALERIGKYDEALDAIAFAKRFNEEPLFYYSEAEIYFRLNRRAKAVAALERALTIKNDDVSLRKKIAEVYFENDMREDAIKVLAAGLAHDPEDEEIPVLIKKYQGE